MYIYEYIYMYIKKYPVDTIASPLCNQSKFSKSLFKMY